METTKTLTQNQKEAVEISRTHNEERSLGKFKTHMTLKTRQTGKQRVTYLTVDDKSGTERNSKKDKHL